MGIFYEFNNTTKRILKTLIQEKSMMVKVGTPVCRLIKSTYPVPEPTTDLNHSAEYFFGEVPPVSCIKTNVFVNK